MSCTNSSIVNSTIMTSNKILKLSDRLFRVIIRLGFRNKRVKKARNFSKKRDKETLFCSSWYRRRGSSRIRKVTEVVFISKKVYGVVFLSTINILNARKTNLVSVYRRTSKSIKIRFMFTAIWEYKVHIVFIFSGTGMNWIVTFSTVIILNTRKLTSFS